MKRLVVQAAKRMGFDVRRSGWEGWTASKLQRLSSPATVIDVGVWHGTPALYDAFPDASLLLIDPLPEALPHMREVLTRRHGSFEAVAVGAMAGSGVLNLPPDTSASSLVHPGSATHATIPVTIETLDDIVGRHPDLVPPHLLKLDIEGKEIAALRGAAAVLGLSDCVIAEVLPEGPFVQSAPSELIGLLADHGFELTELLEVRRDRGTSIVRRMDVAFTKRSAKP